MMNAQVLMEMRVVRNCEGRNKDIAAVVDIGKVRLDHKDYM